MRMSWAVTAVLASGLLAAPVRAEVDPAKIDRAAERVLDGSYQDVPGPRAEQPDSARSRERTSSRDRGGYAGGSPGGPGGALGGILSWLLWGALAVGAVLLVLFIVKEIARSRSDKTIKPEPGTFEEPVPVEAALDRPLEDAEALARDGRFAEAIHMLLLRTFQELVRASSVKIVPSLTSREILGRIPLLGDGRDALTELVTVVEVTWFGDDVPGEAEWLRCRGAFDRFATAYRAALLPAERAREAA